MFALIGAMSLLEVAALIVFILVMGWATGLDRQGTHDAKWKILGTGFLLYWIYFIFTSGVGEWFPPVFSTSFWTSSSTYWSLTEYLCIGVVYAVIEMFTMLLEEKAEIKSRWNLELEADDGLKSYVTGAIGDTENSKYHMLVNRFCSRWRAHDHLVQLMQHELERTPQPTLNIYAVNLRVFPWIILWPGYLVSLMCGRLLDRVIKAVNAAFRRLGTAIVRVLFRNTFKIN